MRMKHDSRKQCSYDLRTPKSEQINTKKVTSTFPYGKISTQHNPQCYGVHAKEKIPKMTMIWRFSRIRSL